ncbi:hypothetical protein F4781DRAFT_435508 [Annulohypoxylon bovei var. microspora]|nr:hypothetical protein F4781DRAFT_435508 [Annulohypoxylon bovei var. microspora]
MTFASIYLRGRSDNSLRDISENFRTRFTSTRRRGVGFRIPDRPPSTNTFPDVYLTTIYGISYGRPSKGESISIYAAAEAVSGSFFRASNHACYKRAGVDVVSNRLSGEGLAKSRRMLAPPRRSVEIGTADRHNPGYTGQMARVVREVEDMLSAGILSAPQPASVFSRPESESPIRYPQTGKWGEYYSDPNSSYAITGSLGGIGRSLASLVCQPRRETPRLAVAVGIELRERDKPAREP